MRWEVESGAGSFAKSTERNRLQPVSLPFLYSFFEGKIRLSKVSQVWQNLITPDHKKFASALRLLG